MAFRSAIPDFQLANAIYVGGRATFYNANELGQSTGVLATLYAAPIGSQTLQNPQILDSEGKNVAPIYIDTPVIAEVVGANVGSHTTGVIAVRGTWRGDWAPATIYFNMDEVVDAASGDIYKVADDYVSSASLAADVAAGHLVKIIDQNAIITGGASRAIKVACRLATTSATADLAHTGLPTIDGVQTVAGDRILDKNQSNAKLNGIWVAAAGAWLRATDADESSNFSDGTVVWVLEGALSGRKAYQLTITAPFVLGTSANNWVALELPQGSIPIDFTAAPDMFLAAGAVGYKYIPYDCTIDVSTLFGDQVGSCVVDIRKSSFAAFPPTDSICAAAKPTLSSQRSVQDTTLTGWTVQCFKGEVLAFVIESVSNLRSLHLDLRVHRN